MGLGVAPAAATAALLAVMTVVRGDDAAGAVAFGLGLAVTAAVGAVVAVRRPDHPCGWLLGLIALLAAASSVGTDYVQSSLAAPTRWPATRLVGWSTTWLAVPTVPLGALVLLTFPSGRIGSRRWRIAAAAVIAAAAAHAIAVALAPGPLPVAPTLDNPLGVEGLGPALDALSGFAGLVGGIVLLAAVLRLILRYRRTAGIERSQLRTLAASLPLTVVGLTAAMLAEGSLLNEVSFYLAVLGLTAIPVSIGWAVLRHGLFDIDVLVNRALVYGSLTVVVGGVYVLVVSGLGSALRQSVDLGASVVATAAVAVAFGPLRDRLQRAVDRLMYGDRSDPYAALSRLGRQLEQATGPEDVLPTTASAIAGSLKLRAVRVDGFSEGDFVMVACDGDPPEDAHPVTLDLVHGRELVGRLSVWPRSGETLSSRDHALLSELSRPVAVAVHAARIDRELKSSRQALVTTREEERRRLRADLHDGLGPELAGVALGLGAARNTVHSDPAAAEALLSRLQTQLRTAVGQVRSLVEGLAPAVEQLGLQQALREGAERLTSPAGIALELDLDIQRAVPAAVEIATFRMVMEALTNAVRHAAPTRCRVAVRLEDALCVVIDDDGIGLPPTIVPGVGLSSMRRRATELGGTWEICESPLGGTRVAAKLPA